MTSVYRLRVGPYDTPATSTVVFSASASPSVSAAPVPHAPPAWTFEPGRESLLAIAVVVLSLTLSHLAQRVKARRLIRKRNNYPVDTPSNALQSSRPEAPRSTLTRAVKARTSTLLYLYVIPPWLYAPETIADAIWTDSRYPFLYLANRFGILAYAQTPIIFLLAVKNNPLSPLTGITYQKLNYLHRASARACIVFAWLHAVLWFLPVLYAGHLFRWYIIWGTVALVAFTGLWGTSVRSLRRRSFEFFLVTHVLFSAAFILGAILHWPLQAYWIWPALAIWTLDRLIRLARLAYINRSHLRRGGVLIKDCTIEVVSRDVMRVTVVRPGLTWKAGQHFFLSSPATGGSIHESHPFSISNLPSPSGSGSGEVIFLIRAHNGFTRRLLLSAPSQPSLLLEGPYGHSHPLSHYSSLLFISGGTGVTFTLSHFLAVLSAIQAGKGVARRVKLVWHVRHAEDMSWITPILDEALADMSSGGEAGGVRKSLKELGVKVELEVWVTRSKSSAEPWEVPMPIPMVLEGGTPIWTRPASPVSLGGGNGGEGRDGGVDEAGGGGGGGRGGGYGSVYSPPSSSESRTGLMADRTGRAERERSREVAEVNEMTRLIPSLGRVGSAISIPARGVPIGAMTPTPLPLLSATHPRHLHPIPDSIHRISRNTQRILTLHPGRADLNHAIETMMESHEGARCTGGDGGGMIVVACGPVPLMNDARAAVGRMNGWGRVRGGGGVVEYLEETVGH